MASPLHITVEQAREIVHKEAISKGWVRPELRQSQEPETIELLETLRSIRESLADIVDVIATGIGSRRGRFILELIQNVEDCDFNHTDRPSIRFEVNPLEIIVESNQDGFVERDVSGICRTGRSWKRGMPGYVGDKGIGFKSVFGVASRVEIQSNAFSFFFAYNGGDTADEKLGIITPIVGDHPIASGQRPLTRMKLTLDGRTSYNALVSDFTAIPKTLLLFLSKLKEISFKVYFPDQARTITTTFGISEEEDRIKCITMQDDASDSPQQWLYHVVRAPLLGLPNDPARPGINECEGVLAFPVDANGSPGARMEHDIYAFLPVCTVGFNFLLQADFLVQANREEVIVDSDWNKEILNKISEVFCNSMDDFSTHPSLRFRWMRFLPIGIASYMNPLWSELSSNILRILGQQRILYPHDPSQQYEGGLRSLPDQLRILPENYLDDRSRSPLFADLPRTNMNKRYLSLNYEQPDVDLLRTAFHLRDIGDAQMVHRIERDLNSPSSVMKDPNTDPYWHSRTADLITFLIDRDPNAANMIKQMLPLVPLSDGRWVTASTTALHFPARSGPPIPQDLAVTIHPDAASNPSRRIMFERLGVTEIRPSRVVSLLWRSYSQQDPASNFDNSKAHLAYLYWHHDQLRSNDARFVRLWLYDNHEARVPCDDVRTIYMPSNDEYGPLELLRSVPDPRNPARFVPECSVRYLNSGYLDLFSPATRRNGLTWLEWLQKGPGVRRNLRLKYRAGSLSPEFRHLLQYRPEKIMKVLRADWTTYRREISNSIEGEISQAEVLCLSSHRAVLATTYFPLPGLMQKAQELGVVQVFPFVRIPDLAEDDIAFEDWRFLDRFGVKFEANLAFYLSVLRQHEGQNGPPWNSETRNGILKTYEAIADHCNAVSRATVVQTFDQNSLILHPRSFLPNSTSAIWLEPQACLWRGPEDLLDKIPLATVASYRNSTKMRMLFNDILGIRNANWTDYQDTLRQFKRRGTFPPDLERKVLELYELLRASRMSDEDLLLLLNTFENERLVYAPQDPFWFAPSQCLWASPVPVPGKAILHPFYSDSLAPFFQTRLNISPASLGTLVEGLRALAQGQPSVLAIKGMIEAINAKDPKREDLTSLADTNFLPIRRTGSVSAVVRFQSCRSNFSIIDRTKLADIFRPCTGFLDFSLEEVQNLAPFLQALGLRNKYLSHLCTEETACGDSGVLDVVLTGRFKNRAYYLLRCAVSNRTPLVVPGHYQNLYGRLLATSVLRTDAISTKYTIRYRNGETVGPIAQNTGHVHIQEHEGGWQIFVPRNRDAKEICYVRELPHALASLFKITTLAGESISHVLNSRISVIDELLEIGGVGKVPGLDAPQRSDVENLYEDREGYEEERLPSRTSIQTNAEEIDAALRESRRVPARPERLGTSSTSNSGQESGEVSPSRTTSPFRIVSPEVPEENGFTRNAYRELLDNVIRIARRAVLPHRDAALSGIGQFHLGYVHNDAFGVRTQGQMNHDFKIGAAGELFVYELLVKLLSPSFNWSNWTSTINSHVLIHPEYFGRDPWPGRRETSDLWYNDREGFLTRHLIRAGYLDGNVWSEATPEYFIEVKTTTGDCDDRFFMSRNQYSIMQEMALREGQVSNKIYVVFRVYNLGRDSLNVKIYVDPEAHRRQGSLEFAQHTWTVMPVIQ
ncbi:hypothetical protein BDZ45DRAFT_673240 [Acephala macrosclerotiorum]|nr:hypothetical protein BDZ45DRAFT_673240 [Acephala macrosclerotiorum]